MREEVGCKMACRGSSKGRRAKTASKGVLSELANWMLGRESAGMGRI